MPTTQRIPWADGGTSIVCGAPGAQRLLLADPGLWPDVVVSIRGSSRIHPSHRLQHDDQRVDVYDFVFDDVSDPHNPDYDPVKPEDIVRIQRIARRFDPAVQRVLFHCAQGISRSTAACVGFWVATGCDVPTAAAKMYRAAARGDLMGLREPHQPRPNKLMLRYFGITLPP